MNQTSTKPASPEQGNKLDRISIAYGDGIGREIMTATLDILKAAGVSLAFDEVKIGKEVYEQGISSGIAPEDWATLRKNKVFLKAPITTPQGSGYKSLNVTIRKSMGLFANVRPFRSFMPYVESNFPDMDLVIIRENEEDLYAGIEHQQTGEVVQCLKLISRPGCERIVRYAFEYARAHGRDRVTCMTKDNIMKHTDGLFHSVFDEIAKEYPDIKSDHYIIDIGSAMLAAQPQEFDVVVTLNLYGDIVSDITAQVGGSVGLGGSANIGQEFAMFEAIHGSAPDIAGKDIANPSGLLNGACMMLQHLGQGEAASLIRNAWLKTIEDGIHTGDIASETFTRQRVGTKAFAEAVIERLGEGPSKLTPEVSNVQKPIKVDITPYVAPEKQLVGVDVFIDWVGEKRDPAVLGRKLEALAGPDFKLKMITNRGVKVYPGGFPETFCTDHWRCRFVGLESTLTLDHNAMKTTSPVSYKSVVGLLNRLEESALNFIKIENLYIIDGKRAYSLGQGE